MQSAPPSAPLPIPPPTVIPHPRSSHLRESQQTRTPGTSAGPALFATPAPVVRPPVIHQPVAPAPTAESEGSDEIELWRVVRRRLLAPVGQEMELTDEEEVAEMEEGAGEEVEVAGGGGGD